MITQRYFTLHPACAGFQFPLRWHNIFGNRDNSIPDLSYDELIEIVHVKGKKTDGERQENYFLFKDNFLTCATISPARGKGKYRIAGKKHQHLNPHFSMVSLWIYRHIYHSWPCPHRFAVEAVCEIMGIELPVLTRRDTTGWSRTVQATLETNNDSKAALPGNVAETPKMMVFKMAYPFKGGYFGYLC